MIKIYGIKNCNSIKKTLNWFEENKIDYEFHDYKKHNIEKAKIESFIDNLSIDKVLNKRGTTWKKLSEQEQKQAEEITQAVDLMQANTSMIKRPIIEHDNGFIAGFDADELKNHFL
jgi:arsenate reductase